MLYKNNILFLKFLKNFDFAIYFWKNVCYNSIYYF